jgi:hypothetical protein
MAEISRKGLASDSAAIARMIPRAEFPKSEQFEAAQGSGRTARRTYGRGETGLSGLRERGEMNSVRCAIQFLPEANGDGRQN